MRAVSNTSPLSGLAMIGRLNLLKLQFSEVWIPTAVSEELDAHPHDVARIALRQAFESGWLRRAPAPDSPLLRMLSVYLHRGESEAIALATELRCDVVLMDEQEGRQFATQAGLSVTGILGILLRAKLRGDIPALKPEIQALRDKARFFVAPALEARVLTEAGERG